MGSMRVKIDRGDVDYIPALDRLVAASNSREFPDQGFAREARLVIEAAEARRRALMQSTNRLLQQSPSERAPNQRSRISYALAEMRGEVGIWSPRLASRQHGFQKRRAG